MAVQCPETYAKTFARPAPVRYRAALHALNDAADSVLAMLRTWRHRIDERQQLSNLDDRMLHDIGLTRTEALYLAEKPFWRE